MHHFVVLNANDFPPGFVVNIGGIKVQPIAAGCGDTGGYGAVDVAIIGCVFFV
jgi:hypothetical protein